MTGTPPGLPSWWRRLARAVLALVLVVVIATGGYLGYAAVRHAQPVTLPPPTGPYPVGRTMVEWTDHDRSDPLAPGTAAARELAVWLWYPAAASALSGPRAAYAPGGWAQVHLAGLPGLAETSFGGVRDHSVTAAPLAAGRFPVVVLEPGLGFAAVQYATIGENLASHGYLVAAVTPTYSANVTVLHGQVVHATQAGNPSALEADLHGPEAQRTADRLVQVWAQDARFTAGQVAALDHSGPFAGHVDATRTAYIGHSFGGAASLQACHDDPHCAAAANLDGTQFGTVVHSGLRQPTLTIASDNSCVTGTCDPTDVVERSVQATARTFFAASAGPSWTYRITGAHHLNFTDYDAYYLGAPLRHLLALGPIRRGRCLTITDDVLAAFIQHALQHLPAPLLDHPTAHYPELRRLS